MPKDQINRHIIMTNGRSGSNYLTNLLNLHPHVINYGEVLAKMIVPCKLYDKCRKIYPWTIESYLEAFYTSRGFFYTGQLYSAYSHFKAKKAINFKKRKQIQNIGIKDFFLNIRKRKAESYFISHPEIAVIYLYRANLLKRYLSATFMKETKIVKTEKGLSITKKVIDIQDMLKKLAILDNELAEEKRMLGEMKTHRILSIKYEDYFSSEQSITDYTQQVFELLRVEPLAVQSKQKKILPDQMSNIIENYEEVHATLVNTKYERYLE